MSAARKISRSAIGDDSTPVTIEEYQISESLAQDSRLSEDLPFSSRGGIAIRHHFPLDGEYVLRIQLQRDRTNFIRGLLGEPHQLDVFLDGVRLERFSVGGERHGATGLLHTRTGNIYMGDPKQNGYELSGAEEGLQVRFAAKAGTRLVGVTSLKKTLETEGLLEVGPRPLPSDIRSVSRGGRPSHRQRLLSLDPTRQKGWEIRPAAGKIFECYPSGTAETGNPIQSVALVPGNDNDEEFCAQKILSRLARRAYRRPVTDEDVQPLLSLYRAGRKGEGL